MSADKLAQIPAGEGFDLALRVFENLKASVRAHRTRRHPGAGSQMTKVQPSPISRTFSAIAFPDIGISKTHDGLPAHELIVL